ncbi:molybdenum cofactor guanylyltransferase MobA [Vogesella oryzae]|uniref:molybdenum cofactor guanylyltransferase MobA n=1 Tax=Vogesella oryzae TaxID=1735285 RepID=UPI001582D2DE|nr:molybdenum cofactor guanylyltransferase MobA [Vogesella oryzae]
MMQLTGPAQLGGLLLAGGEGRRMGGVDKGQQLLCGQPLAAHVLARLAPQLGWLAISANRSLDAYASFGLPVWPDAAAWQGMGPLAALATAAQRLPAGIALLQLAPCDTPDLPAELAATLAAALTAGTADIALPVTAQGPQPACLLLKVCVLASVAPYLASGQRSIRGWLAGQRVVEVPFADAAAFANANDAATLAALTAGRHAG